MDALTIWPCLRLLLIGLNDGFALLLGSSFAKAATAAGWAACAREGGTEVPADRYKSQLAA